MCGLKPAPTSGTKAKSEAQSGAKAPFETGLIQGPEGPLLPKSKSIPQGLKPISRWSLYATAEAVALTKKGTGNSKNKQKQIPAFAGMTNKKAKAKAKAKAKTKTKTKARKIY